MIEDLLKKIFGDKNAKDKKGVNVSRTVPITIK
mgnify:CR=1 FL=1